MRMAVSALAAVLAMQGGPSRNTSFAVADLDAVGICATDGRLQVICGAERPEDLVTLEGTPWILVTRYGQGIALAHAHTKSLRRLFPSSEARVAIDHATYPDCRVPTSGANEPLRVLGLSAQRVGPDRFRLYAVGLADHAGVYIFDLNLPGATPAVTLIGCVPAPDNAFLNSVTPLPGNGFATTLFASRDDLPARRAELEQGLIMGSVLEWHPGGDWKTVPGSEMAAPNGIVASHDGSELFVNSYGEKKVVRLSLRSLPPRRAEVATGFSMDNLRWDPKGRLLATGHTHDRTAVFRVAPRTLRYRKLLDRADDAFFYHGTVAVQVGRELWIGSSRGTRIAVLPAR